MNVWWLWGLLFGVTSLATAFIVYPLRSNLRLSVVLVPVIFILAFSGYYYWGSLDGWQGYIQNQERQKQATAMLQSIKNPQELIAQLRAKLDDSLQSTKGWYLLGRLYSGQNERQHAVDAFAKAYQFAPQNEQYVVNYAYSLWQLNNRQFTEQITELFSNVLKINPNQPDALAMLAMDAYVSQAYEDAIDYWQRFLKGAPQQSEEVAAIRRAIAKAEEQIKVRAKNLD